MAFTKFLVTVSAFAALTSALPLAVERRAGAPPSMVTETEWVTKDVPVTLYVDAAGKPIHTVFPPEVSAVQTVQTTSSQVPAKPAYTRPKEQTTTPEIVQTTTASQEVKNVLPSTTQAPPPPPPAAATPTTTQAPPPPPAAPVTTTPAQQQAQPAPASSSAPQANKLSGQSTGDVSASSSASCEGQGAACSGDVTHYEGGMGACGWVVDTATEFMIALPHGFMGVLSNSNPYCGRSLTIRNPTTGATAQAKVADKCMGCEGRSIDLTDALFKQIAPDCDGRCSGYQWWFN